MDLDGPKKRIVAERLAPNDPLFRLNTLCPYFTMFPLSFPIARLRNAAKNACVLDPFCGRGTTNFAARILGLPSVGVDTNPVAVSIAKAKFANVAASQVVRRAEDILRGRSQIRDVPAGPFWHRCFHPKTLLEIAKIREHLMSWERSSSTPTETQKRRSAA